jgi:flavin reductase
MTPKTVALTEPTPEAERFREAMSRIAATVHVVTTDGPAGRHGATATSVVSLTDQPPTLIVCLNLSSRTHRLASRNGIVAVNALAADQEDVARAFSRSSAGAEDRFAHGDWAPLITGAPTLAHALAVFDGRIVSEIVVGTHAAMIVELEAVRFAKGPADGLSYHRRRYRPYSGSAG